MTAMFFLITACMGSTNEWNRRARYLTDHLSWDDARSLLRAGFEIGSHTRLHHSLLKLDDERLADELSGAIGDIRTHLDHEARFVAYPYGDHDARVTRAAADHHTLGFAAGKKGAVDWRSGPFEIHRIGVTADLEMDQLDARIRAVRGSGSKLI